MTWRNEAKLRCNQMALALQDSTSEYTLGQPPTDPGEFGDTDDKFRGHLRESTLHLQFGYRREEDVGDLAIYFVVSMTGEMGV